MPRHLATLGWGLFCASSWTWCIGMYLPVLLIRHFGWPGVLAFAVPNVAGCVAFGYVVRDGEGTRRITETNAGACRAFSHVTVAFHLFFAAFVGAYLIRTPFPPIHVALGATVGLYAAASALSRLPNRAWPATAPVIYGVSLVAFVCLGIRPLAAIGWQGDLDGGSLVFLAPTLAFGFLLCPYLDLTFHRALASSPSRHAFAVFGVAFGVMILLTCAYWDAASQGLPVAALVHVAAQAVFTVAVHLRELRSASVSRPAVVTWLKAAVPFAAVPLALVPLAWPKPLEAAEGMYLRMLVFYGLVFPTYVVWFLGRSPALAVSRRNLLFLSALVAAAAPLFELGFLHEQTWYPLIAVAALVGGAGVYGSVRGRDRTPGPDVSAPNPNPATTRPERRIPVTKT